MQTKRIEFTDGKLTGKQAFVTYEDDDYLRVTPVDGDPLVSIDLFYSAGGFKLVEEPQ